MAKVFIHDVHPHIIFEWFHSSIAGEGGDGSGAICCKNHEQAFEHFMQWTNLKKYNILRSKEIDRYNFNGVDIINIHDNNENFMFANKEIYLGYDDISFIIAKDCVHILTDINSIKLEQL